MWVEFFVAAAGASAALAGLIFVAMSVNIGRILQLPHLPSRAATTIGTLILILVSSMAALIHQPAAALGAEILGFGICAWMLDAWSIRRALVEGARLGRPLYAAVLGAVVGQIQLLPFIVGSLLLLSGRPGGLYWIAGGVIAIFIGSALNGWVLLVEILR